MRRAVLSVVFWAVASATALAVFAVTEIEGQGPGGAFYSIAVPDSWNGELVIWNHGFSLSDPSPSPDVGPLSDIHLLEGYAVAASSYRLSGWALFKSNQDLRELVEIFSAEFGPPERILIYGASLGGAVTAAAVEKGNLGNVVGALTFCGAMAGSRNWDVAVDLRLAYDLVCEDVPGAAIPGGAEGLPEDSGWTSNDVENAVDTCTGINTPKSERSRQQKANLRQLLDLARIPASFLVPDMLYATEGMSDLVHDRKKLRGKLGTGNEFVVYGDPVVDAQIERVKPRRGKARKLARFFTPKGNVGQTKIISMHTNKDGLVLVENQSIYADVVPAGNLTTVIVRERQASHCVFSPGEILAGWEALRAWVDSGLQPTAGDIQEACEDSLGIDEICRIDPAFALPNPDIRMRPRNWEWN